MSELTRKPLQGLADPLAPVRYLDVVLLVLAAPIVILMGGPVLGYAVGAGVWILQRIAEAWLDAAGQRTDAKRAVGLKFASMIGAHLARRDRHPRRRPRRRARGRVHRRRRLPRRLHRPPGHRPDPALAGEEHPPRHEHPEQSPDRHRRRPTSGRSSSRCSIFGFARTTTRSSAAERVQARHVGRARAVRHQQGGPLPLHRGVPDRGDHAVDLQADAGQARTACRRWSSCSTRPCATRSRAGNMDDQMATQVVPLHRDALPLHLVLEPDRLHPAADQHGAQDRRASASRSRRSPSTRRRRTSRSRSCSRSSSSSPTTSRASARRASSGT